MSKVLKSEDFPERDFDVYGRVDTMRATVNRLYFNTLELDCGFVFHCIQYELAAWRQWNMVLGELVGIGYTHIEGKHFCSMLPIMTEVLAAIQHLLRRMGGC